MPVAGRNAYARGVASNARRRKGLTRLARVREWRGLEQAELARAAGISVATLRRIETNPDANPPIRYLTNLSIVLRVRLEDVMEPDWKRWAKLNERTPDKPLPAEGMLANPQETSVPTDVLYGYDRP